jgi:predicted XRE-type DNA-binding protein
MTRISPRRNKPHQVFEHIDMSGGPDACWPWMQAPGATSRAMRDGKKSMKSKPRPYYTVAGKKHMATRLVYELVNGVTLSPTTFILHQCDNSLCCNPKHMRVGTHDENMKEMVERDRHGLPHDMVRRIRVALMQKKLTQQEIADLTGVSRATVGRIARDELHTHADDYPDAAE